MMEIIYYLNSRGWSIDASVNGHRLVEVEYALQNLDLYFDNIWCYLLTPFACICISWQKFSYQ